MNSKSREEPKHVDPGALSEFELSLTILWNSVKRWMNQRSKESVLNGLSNLDVFLMHLLVYRDRQLRANDMAFALSIDDMHLVSYSLKKLVRMEAITSSKIGKEVFYQAADKAKAHYREFLEDRARYLEPAMDHLNYADYDLESLTPILRTLSGVYEQAARTAASARGLK
jgi:predicted MarR family transcription regulator